MLSFELIDAKDCVLVSEIIGKSFKSQAELLGIVRQEYPNFVVFETAEQVRRRIDRGDHVMIARLANVPVGTVSWNMDTDQPGKGYIKRLAVLPEFRGNKYGDLLMQYAESMLISCGMSRIELSIIAMFAPLQRYYETLGYVPTHKACPPSLPFEVLYMQKMLGA